MVANSFKPCTYTLDNYEATGNNALRAGYFTTMLLMWNVCDAMIFRLKRAFWRSNSLDEHDVGLLILLDDLESGRIGKKIV